MKKNNTVFMYDDQMVLNSAKCLHYFEFLKAFNLFSKI